MVYLIVFVLCLCADYYRNFRILSILIIYIILCFGYTTGTDWISYELYYKYGIENAHFATREPGLGVLINLANYFTSDFWIFNGFCKVFYLWTLTRMISFFTHRVWSVVALTLIFSTMFILINCPMRFMLACSLLYLGICMIMKKRNLFASICFILAVSFHLTIIIPIFFYLTGVLSNRFFLIKKNHLVIITVLVIYLSTLSGIYHYIFSHVLSILGLDAFISGSYSFFTSDSVLSFGSLRNIILALFLIYYKDNFLGFKYGKLIFFYAITFFWVDILFRSVPTAFRLSIFNGIFACAALSLLLFTRIKKGIIVKNLYKKGIIALFVIILLKTSYGSYVYYPYTNSIPYIIGGHENYFVRENYNKKKYSETFGFNDSDGGSETTWQRID